MHTLNILIACVTLAVAIPRRDAPEWTRSQMKMVCNLLVKNTDPSPADSLAPASPNKPPACKPVGVGCSSSSECCGNECIGGICLDWTEARASSFCHGFPPSNPCRGDCSTGSYCVQSPGGFCTCMLRNTSISPPDVACYPLYHPCSASSQCCSGSCSGICTPWSKPRTYPNRGNKCTADGQPCTSDASCCSSSCVNRICTNWNAADIVNRTGDLCGGSGSLCFGICFGGQICSSTGNDCACTQRAPQRTDAATAVTDNAQETPGRAHPATTSGIECGQAGMCPDNYLCCNGQYNQWCCPNGKICGCGQPWDRCGGWHGCSWPGSNSSCRVTTCW